MGENEQQCEEWENNWEELLEPAPVCCIYRVPEFLRNINEDCYTPKLISIGPLHHGSEKLRVMQSQKKRYLSKFGQRVNGQKMEEFKTYIKDQEKHIRAHYSVTSTLKSLEYVAMILNDAVFIIELLLRNFHSTDDFLLKLPWKGFIRCDLLFLENQLPYFVLNDLYMKAFPPASFSQDSTFFDHLFQTFFFENTSFLPRRQPKHFTDYIRWLMIRDGASPAQSHEGNHDISHLPRATNLSKSGLKFTSKQKGRLGLLDIRYVSKRLPLIKENELEVPQIFLDEHTENFFRNLMALEMFHYPTNTYICHYAALMDRLIDTEKDVELLVDKGIIVNQMGDYGAIAKMFNRLCSNIILSKYSGYNDIAWELQAHYKNRWNHAKATLKSVYFSNLWAGTATIAAGFLLLLTLIQTICSIMQNGNSRDNGTSS